MRSCLSLLLVCALLFSLSGCGGAPAQPSAPAEPPAQELTPPQPEPSAQPEVPTQPEAPAQPETPTQPEAPAQPETPTQPETPAEPADPAATEETQEGETVPICHLPPAEKPAAPEKSGNTPASPAPTPVSAGGPVAAAQYPQSPQRPDEQSFFADPAADYDAYHRAYQVWNQAQSARRDALPDTSSLAAFFREGTGQFLSGSAENRVWSPVNVYMALAMLAEVTGGESREQLLTLLGADSVEALRAQAGSLWRALYTDDGTSTVTLGSSLWMNDLVRFRQDTMETLARNYYASSFAGRMGSPELNASLQAWLNEQTHGLLQEQAGSVQLDPQTVLALATAIYFKAAWESQFSESQTYSQTFHAPDKDCEADFLHSSETGTVYYGKGFTAVARELSEGRMWLLLPDEGVTLDALLDGRAMEFLAVPSAAGSTYATIRLSLPKFDVDSDLDLIEGLEALGVTSVFGPGADFTPMTTDIEEIAVDQIRHAARVKIDEEGCEAAAFTLITMRATAMPEEPPAVDFTLDRPFLFAVTGMGGLPLFVGTVNQPVKG
ncbi:MAG: hypothetical protein IJ221_05050 [Oscillibacter sp.]|nr:hypothetical protein [Oscillibacter sp.]